LFSVLLEMKASFVSVLLLCVAAGTLADLATDEDGNMPLKATGDITINLLVAALDPMLYSIDGGNYWNGEKQIRTSEYFGLSLNASLSFWISNFEEISHQRVRFNVVDTIIIDEFPKFDNL